MACCGNVKLMARSILASCKLLKRILVLCNLSEHNVQFIRAKRQGLMHGRRLFHFCYVSKTRLAKIDLVRQTRVKRLFFFNTSCVTSRVSVTPETHKG